MRNYIAKADFWDNRIVNKRDDTLMNNSCTIEIFQNVDDRDSRWEYLYQFTDAAFGAVGLKQYMVMYSDSIFRISYDFSRATIEQYIELLNSLYEASPVKQTYSAEFAVEEDGKTAGDMVAVLQDNIEYVSKTEVYSEETDLNGILGKPGNYIGKADFWDSRITGGKNAGTIETFATEADCNSRWTYLSNFLDASLGAFGLNQYMVMYEKTLLRVSFDLAPDQAVEYINAINEFLDSEPVKSTMK